ncbi:ABC transporter substrate-binding protein [Phytoactinopolyspora limicola]|uniref:ABC transporter substrate-binding protein n=1 Tax=Phytoactinopolyspora limicola TaxID=2715536 RepID=UPI001407E676|nr:ABC transporter substrate-binding protein [Phytoactinopolyspora limicola]
MAPGGAARVSRASMLAGVLCSVLVLTSCSLFERVVADEEAGSREAAVVVLAPGGTASGDAVMDAVELAIGETASDVPGWTIDVRFVADDSHDDGPAELVREVAEDDVIAVIGGMSTEVVRAAQPVLSASSVLFVSPADTVPEHTRGADPGAPLRPYPNYFRTVVTGEHPLRMLARHAVGSLEADRIAVIDAGDHDESAAFAEAVDRAGGEVVQIADDAADDEAVDDEAVDDEAVDDEAVDDEAVDDEAVDDEAVDDETVTSAALVQAVRDADAGAVFVTGSSALAAALADELARTGGGVELLGGAALMNDDFLAEAGSSAEGAWTAVAGELAGSDDDNTRSRLAESGLDVGVPQVAAAYDAGLAVGTVLTGCLPPASSAAAARRGCIGEMAEVTVGGGTAELAFDEYGDRVGANPVLLKVNGNVWSPLAVEPR